MEKQLDDELYGQLVHKITEGFLGVSQLDHLSENKNWKPPVIGEKGLINHHLSDSTFEDCADILCSVGVMTMVSCHDGMPHRKNCACSRMEMNLEEVVDYVVRLRQQQPSNKHASLQYVISRFVDLSTGYHKPDNCLSTDRDFFTPTIACQRVFKLMARHKYVEQFGEQYRWTDKVTPAMLYNLSWYEIHISSDTDFGKIMNAKAAETWEVMPNSLKERLLKCRLGNHNLARFLSMHWKKGKWIEEPARFTTNDVIDNIWLATFIVKNFLK